jgi:hypothetical protein
MVFSWLHRVGRALNNFGGAMERAEVYTGSDATNIANTYSAVNEEGLRGSALMADDRMFESARAEEERNPHHH